MKLPRPRLFAGGAAALAAAGAVAAYASIPDSGQVIHGCYQRESGQLRVIDTDRGQSCRPSERALDWNQQGPKGAPGPPGPPGPGKLVSGSADTGFSSDFRPTPRVLHIAGFGTVVARYCKQHTEGETGGGAVLELVNETSTVARVAHSATPAGGLGSGVNLAPGHGATVLFTFSNGSTPSGTQVSQIKSVGSGRIATLTASVVMDGQGCHFFAQATSS